MISEDGKGEEEPLTPDHSLKFIKTTTPLLDDAVPSSFEKMNNFNVKNNSLSNSSDAPNNELLNTDPPYSNKSADAKESVKYVLEQNVLSSKVENNEATGSQSSQSLLPKKLLKPVSLNEALLGSDISVGSPGLNEEALGCDISVDSPGPNEEALGADICVGYPRSNEELGSDTSIHSPPMTISGHTENKCSMKCNVSLNPSNLSISGSVTDVLSSTVSKDNEISNLQGKSPNDSTINEMEDERNTEVSNTSQHEQSSPIRLNGLIRKLDHPNTDTGYLPKDTEKKIEKEIGEECDKMDTSNSLTVDSSVIIPKKTKSLSSTGDELSRNELGSPSVSQNKHEFWNSFMAVDDEIEDPEAKSISTEIDNVLSDLEATDTETNKSDPCVTKKNESSMSADHLNVEKSKVTSKTCQRVMDKDFNVRTASLSSNNIVTKKFPTTKMKESIKSKKPLKTKRAKSPSFLEIVNTLEAEDPLLSPMQPKPLDSVEDSVSCPSEASLTLLDSNKKTKSRDVPCSTNSSIQNSSSNRSKRSIGDVTESSDSEKQDLKKFRVLKGKNLSPDKKDMGSKKYNKNETKKFLVESKQVEKYLEEEKSHSRLKDPVEPMLIDTHGAFPSVDKEEIERLTAYEVEKMRSKSYRKLQKIGRKELENLIIQLFVDRVLYEHELGHQRDLCKRLEATLETNRKKAAQFHKEIDDLKKVTQRLQAEHTARKSHIIAPVKVKRSVGIQANPSIITKGIMQANQPNMKILSPSPNAQVSQSKTPPIPAVSPSVPKETKNVSTQIQNSFIQVPNKVFASVSSPVCISGQVTSQGIHAVAKSPSVAPTQMLMVSPSHIVVPKTGTPQVNPGIRPIGSTQVTVPTNAKNISNNYIDLTDDGEAKSNVLKANAQNMVAIPRPALNLANAATGQFITVPQTPMNQQLLLVPASNGQTTATLVVSSMPNTVPALASGTTIKPAATLVRTNGGATLNIGQPGGVRLASSPSTILNATRVVLSPAVNGNIAPHTNIPRHPAPLPKTPIQQTSGVSSKKLPPQPILNLSHKENSIVLLWKMAKTDEHESISSYQLYAYQEGTAPPVSTLWKKVGSVKALELPMACTLTQFMPGHVYHFAVRAVDTRCRYGPFSDPKSIRLGK